MLDFVPRASHRPVNKSQTWRVHHIIRTSGLGVCVDLLLQRHLRMSCTFAASPFHARFRSAEARGGMDWFRELAQLGGFCRNSWLLLPQPDSVRCPAEYRSPWCSSHIWPKAQVPLQWYVASRAELLNDANMPQPGTLRSSSSPFWLPELSPAALISLSGHSLLTTLSAS